MAGTTSLFALSNNSNPSATVTGTTGAAIAAGDKVVVHLLIPNGNPTSLVVTIDGQALTEIVSARSIRSNNTILAFYLDDVSGRASGKAFSATWVNSGTTAGGGSLAVGITITPTNAFASGTADAVGIANGLSQLPSTGASGTPSNSSAKYYAVAALGSENATAGQVTADNSYVSVTEAVNAARIIMLDVATKEFSATVAAQTETWTPTWGGNKPWEGSILLFMETVPGVPVNTVAPAVTGTSAVGSVLSSDNGSWTNTPLSYNYQWYRDVGTAGATWLAISGATASTYTLTNSDIGSKHKCNVVAVNGSGNSLPQASNSTTTMVPAPSGLSFRLVAGPVAQSDAQTHSQTLALPVLPNDRLVVLTSCSNSNTIDGNGNKSDVGSVTDTGGNTWVEDMEEFSDASVLHSAQAFSACITNGLAYGSTVTMTVHGGTGAGGYHGQSPYWIIVAVSSSTGVNPTLNVASKSVDILLNHAAATVTTAASAVVLGHHNYDGTVSPGWWTPAAGFTEICDTIDAAQAGGESGYAISAEGQVVSSPYTGGAGGTTGSNKAISNILVAYSIPTAPPTGSVITDLADTTAATGAGYTVSRRTRYINATTIEYITDIQKTLYPSVGERLVWNACGSSFTSSAAADAQAVAALNANRRHRYSGSPGYASSIVNTPHGETLVVDQT